MNPPQTKFNTEKSTPPKTLTSKECHLLLAELSQYGTTEKQKCRATRNWTMATIMLEAGLRVGELVKLSGRDLMFNGEPVNTIIVRAEITKTKTQRMIPTSEKLRKALVEMADVVWNPDTNFTIPFAFYQNDPNKPLTTRQVERIIKAAAMISLGRPIHPHILRHTFGTVLMRIANPRIVQQLLGHKNLNTTQIYMHPNHQDLTDAIDKMENNSPCE